MCAHSYMAYFIPPSLTGMYRFFKKNSLVSFWLLNPTILEGQWLEAEMAKGRSYRKKIAFRSPSCIGLKFKTFLGPLFTRTGKEKPSRNGRRPQRLMSLMSRNRVGSGKFIFLLLSNCPVAFGSLKSTAAVCWVWAAQGSCAFHLGAQARPWVLSAPPAPVKGGSAHPSWGMHLFDTT